MVKGISRRVIVVKTPDPRFFEQAIFIVREDAFGRQGVSAQQVVDEAQRVAEGYVRRSSTRLRLLTRLPAPVYAAAGALAASACWLAAVLL